jgi:hypothetical protein
MPGESGEAGRSQRREKMDLTERQNAILARLEELYELQKPLRQAISADQATRKPVSYEELHAYGKRADEIEALNRELIESVKSS